MTRQLRTEETQVASWDSPSCPPTMTGRGQCCLGSPGPGEARGHPAGRDRLPPQGPRGGNPALGLGVWGSGGCPDPPVPTGAAGAAGAAGPAAGARRGGRQQAGPDGRPAPHPQPVRGHGCQQRPGDRGVVQVQGAVGAGCPTDGWPGCPLPRCHHLGAGVGGVWGLGSLLSPLGPGMFLLATCSWGHVPAVGQSRVVFPRRVPPEHSPALWSHATARVPCPSSRI